MAYDVGRGDPAGPSRVPADSVSNRGLQVPARLDTSFSTAAGAAAAATSEVTPTLSSTSRQDSLLGDLPQFRPQSLHLPSPARHAHARARLARRWTTTSSPRADVNPLRTGGTAASTTATATAAETAATSTAAIAIPVRRPSALQRVASSIRRLTTHTSHPSGSRAAAEEGGEDWSVFGELMAHEGAALSLSQSAPLSPLSSSRSPSSSRARRSDAGEGVVPNMQVLLSAPVGEPGYTSSIRRTQSPTSDYHFEDYFPLEAEEVGDEERAAEGNYHDGVSSSDAGLRRSRMRVDSDTELLSSTSSYRGSSHKDRSLSRGKERSWQRLLHLPTLPTLYRNILKCSLAYFLGSLFTYYPPLAQFISELTQDSPGELYPSVMGHMVATV